MRNSIVISSTLVVISASLVGCTSTIGGQYTTQNRFIAPNANVEPLGTATAQASDTAWLGFGFPRITLDDYKAAYADAVASVPGADALINISETYELTDFVLGTTLTLKMSGTAVNVEGGMQDLRDR